MSDEMTRAAAELAEAETLVRVVFGLLGKRNRELTAVLMLEYDWRAAELGRLRAQRDAVLAMHKRNKIGEQVTCGHCSIAGMRGDVAVQLAAVLWPCPTVRAVEGAA